MHFAPDTISTRVQLLAVLVNMLIGFLSWIFECHGFGILQY